MGKNCQLANALKPFLIMSLNESCGRISVMNEKTTDANNKSIHWSPDWTAEDVRQLRYRMGWSRAELARFMNLSIATVNAWEAENVRPTDQQCNALLMILNQAESNSEKVQRRPFAEVVMRDRGLSQIHDLEVIDALIGKA
jgi:DNA-binding transcriptional regulator YiaG